MATKKIHTALNVEHIFCTVTCPWCQGTVTMKMCGPVTRKSCPKCNHITYIFTITPLRGYVQMSVTTIGPDETPTEYDIFESEIEVVEDSVDQEE